MPSKKIIRKDLGGIILTPIQELGNSRTGTINGSYDDIKSHIGMPNVTKLDDPDKVKASWGLQDQQGRKLFVWCYKYGRPSQCFNWSCDGDPELIKEVFGEMVAEPYKLF